jgi:hypothetical protein
MLWPRMTPRAAAATAALALSAAPIALAAGSPGFDGPTIKNPAVPPAFTLHDQNGNVVRLGQQRGHVVLITFLYTHCLDVCPLTAAHLNQALRMLGPKRTQVRVFAISVDPKGDTAGAVKRFILGGLLGAAHQPGDRIPLGATGAEERQRGRFTEPEIVYPVGAPARHAKLARTARLGAAPFGLTRPNKNGRFEAFMPSSGSAGYRHRAEVTG